MKSPTSPTPSRAYGASSPLPAPANTSRSCLSATTKSYKYLRRLLKFDQMDFEFALWQMLYLFVSPQKVYRNFNYRKRKQNTILNFGDMNIDDFLKKQRVSDETMCSRRFFPGSSESRRLFPALFHFYHSRNKITICQGRSCVSCSSNCLSLW